MPIGILGSLIICTILYILTSAVLVGIVPYTDLNDPAPIAKAVNQIGLPWFAVLVKIGAIAGLSSVMLVLLYGQTRIFYTMARDGLIPPVFAQVHPKFKTPWINTLIVGVLACGFAGFMGLDALANLTNVGTLVAFAIVCVTVIYLRFARPDMQRPFKTPLFPLTPLLGARDVPLPADVADGARDDAELLPRLSRRRHRALLRVRHVELEARQGHRRARPRSIGGIASSEGSGLIAVQTMRPRASVEEGGEMDFLMTAIDMVLHVDRHLRRVRDDVRPVDLRAAVPDHLSRDRRRRHAVPARRLVAVRDGALAAAGVIDIVGILTLLTAAAIIGDNTNYFIGRAVGPRVFTEHSRWLKREHLLRTQRFYEQHGGKTVVIARFVPIVRTFAPFVAGVGRMHYPRFLAFDVGGGILWVWSFGLLGYFFGNAPIIKENFGLAIIGVILISLLPIVVRGMARAHGARTRRLMSAYADELGRCHARRAGARDRALLHVAAQRRAARARARVDHRRLRRRSAAARGDGRVFRSICSSRWPA